MNDTNTTVHQTPTDKFRGVYNALFRYPIRDDETDEWELQILDRFGHVTATEAIRALSDGGIGHSPTLQEVKRAIIASLPRRDDGPRRLCSCCHGDGGVMTFGALYEIETYPASRRIVSVCGYLGWCPDLSGNPPEFPRNEGDLYLPPESCAVKANPGMRCNATGIYCKCSSGEAKLQRQISKGAIRDIPKYEALRSMVHEAMVKRLAWESGRDTGERVDVDTSAASAVSLAMIRKFD